jgi:hypothetical protein
VFGHKSHSHRKPIVESNQSNNFPKFESTLMHENLVPVRVGVYGKRLDFSLYKKLKSKPEAPS